MEGSCEHGNEPSGSIKCWEFLEWPHNWQLLKKCSAPWASEWVDHTRVNKFFVEYCLWVTTYGHTDCTKFEAIYCLLSVLSQSSLHLPHSPLFTATTLLEIRLHKPTSSLRHTFKILRWRQHVPPKHEYPHIVQNGVTHIWAIIAIHISELIFRELCVRNTLNAFRNLKRFLSQASVLLFCFKSNWKYPTQFSENIQYWNKEKIPMI
jgi:hypothetical protein